MVGGSHTQLAGGPHMWLAGVSRVLSTANSQKPTQKWLQEYICLLFTREPLYETETDA